MAKRLPSQATSLKERLTKFANDAQARAYASSPGPERDALLKAARLAETTSHIEDWLSAPGMKAPD